MSVASRTQPLSWLSVKDEGNHSVVGMKQRNNTFAAFSCALCTGGQTVDSRFVRSTFN